MGPRSAGRPACGGGGGGAGDRQDRMAAELCVRAHAGGALVLAGRAHEDALIPYEPFVEALRRYAAECPDQALRDQVGAHTKVLRRCSPNWRTGSAWTSTQVRASVRRGWSRRSPRSCVRPQAHAQRSCCSRTCIGLRRPARWRCAIWCAAPKTLGFSCSSPTATPSRPRAPARRRAGGGPASAGPVRDRAERPRRALRRSDRGREGRREQSAELIAAVHARTAGNPFFIEELVRERATWRRRAGGPRSVQDLLARRLRGMPR